MSTSIRKNGSVKIALGTIAFLVISFFVYWLQTEGYSPNGFALIGLGAPIAWGLVGLLEVVMNRPFSEMEEWWNALKGWQRGLIGISVVIIAFTLLIGAMALAGTLGLI